MKNGWSVKKLNHLILTSETYRRSSRHPDPESLAEKDPKGQLYSRFLPRRLVAEEIRDAMLRVSGELNPRVGGIPYVRILILKLLSNPDKSWGALHQFMNRIRFRNKGTDALSTLRNYAVCVTLSLRRSINLALMLPVNCVSLPRWLRRLLLF